MTHWVKQLKAENAALRVALRKACMALRSIPQSRFDKYVGADNSDSSLGYRKAVQEVDRLNLAAITDIADGLADAGVQV
jgi:hypothetical protein